MVIDADADASTFVIDTDGEEKRVSSRGCHEYIPMAYIRALYPYPLRIRAGDAYPKCNMRNGGEDTSILSFRN